MKNGLYIVYFSLSKTPVLAALGRDHMGYVWIAPTNWTGMSDTREFVPVAKINMHKNIVRVEPILLEEDMPIEKINEGVNTHVNSYLDGFLAGQKSVRDFVEKNIEQAITDAIKEIKNG